MKTERKQGVKGEEETKGEIREGKGREQEDDRRKKRERRKRME